MLESEYYNSFYLSLYGYAFTPYHVSWYNDESHLCTNNLQQDSFPVLFIVYNVQDRTFSITLESHPS
jgi:hypothetical protein